MSSEFFFFFSNLLLLLHNCLVTLSGLILIFDDILLLKLAHALNLIEVDHEAFIVSMQRLYALTAEDVQVVRAIEVLDALRVLLTKLLRETVLIFILEVEAGACQDGVLLHNLVQNVDV